MAKVEDLKIISTHDEDFLSKQLKFFLNKGYEPYTGNVMGGDNSCEYVAALIKYEVLKVKETKKKKVMI